VPASCEVTPFGNDGHRTRTAAQWRVGDRWSGAVGFLDWMKRGDKIARQAPGTKAVVGQPELIRSGAYACF
jgi:hypothetical protein